VVALAYYIAAALPRGWDWPTWNTTFIKPCEMLASGFPRWRSFSRTDGRVALWLNLAPGAQETYVDADPTRFFVPPYVGSRGWLGVHLDKGLAWQRIAALVREAYEKVSPPVLASALGNTPVMRTPARNLSAGEINPMQSPRGKALLKTVRKICLRFPESREGIQFGCPVWQAGKKTFAWARCAGQRFTLCFWVGVDQQHLLTADARYQTHATEPCNAPS
jgi:hypothetical protein